MQPPKSVDNSLKIEVADDAVTEPKARALGRLKPSKRSAVERSRAGFDSKARPSSRCAPSSSGARLKVCVRLLRSFTPLPTACALRLRVISGRGGQPISQIIRPSSASGGHLSIRSWSISGV